MFPTLISIHLNNKMYDLTHVLYNLCVIN